MDSIYQQTWKNRELIIIDGASQDDTLRIIEANKEHINYWTSEPDNGIYDAWNKALAKTSGQWISFIGADDRYENPQALTLMMELALSDGQVDFVSGRSIQCDATGRIPRVKGGVWKWSRFKCTMGTIVHRTALHSRNIFKKVGTFDISYRIAGDYDLLLRLGPYLRTAFLPEIVVEVGRTGVSKRQVGRAYREAFRAQQGCSYISTYEAVLFYLIGIATYYLGATKHRLSRL